MTSAASEAHSLAEVIDCELRARGSSARASKERAYLKSELVHSGVGVPATRAVVREALRGVELDHDTVIALAEVLWNSASDADGMGGVTSGAPVYELRSAATMVLIQTKDRLGAGDSDFFERLLRQARTWALVDPLACDVIGPLSEHDEGFGPVLERWAVDEDFWIRRSALLAHLRPLREGRGDFARFARFADEMLDEKEFFIRKAIGWVLRDAARKRPELVFDWMLPRAHRASGVTMRELVKHLSPEQRNELLAAKESSRTRAGSG
ncbi:DNA alkylation repair enzyme [Brevibacterium sandarakinum]|uniref:DNA alkylation repair enzyme n=1 Tax=Brevibacterium sandarakinum TaxID=629680 RepID=A0A1H1TUN1_BRESA|nr:DNA alkylation repair protein [Brevibacterium sandarakinum]SDS63902.1 DNA alkylation repair enzyme [Brevibacterium sandarakinum]